MAESFDIPYSYPTIIESAEIVCPECRQSSPFDVWTIVNAEENPEAIQKIADLQLCEFTCSYCGHVLYLAYSCLFCDSDKLYYIYSVADKDEEDAAEKFFVKLKNRAPSGSICRIVTDWFKFGEKVRIFSKGLDDRLIELLKLTIRDDFKNQTRLNLKDNADIQFTDLNEDNSLVFSIDCYGIPYLAQVPMEVYSQFLHAFGEADLVNHECLRIDQIWAAQTFSRIGNARI